MKITSPWGGELDFAPELCSKTLPNEHGVLTTGYLAKCPKTGNAFEISVVVTGLGTDAEEATIGAGPVQNAAILADQRNAVADTARAKFMDKAEREAVATTEKMAAVAASAGATLTPQMLAKIKKTVQRDLMRQAVAPILIEHDAKVKKELVKAVAANRELADAAIARAGS